MAIPSRCTAKYWDDSRYSTSARQAVMLVSRSFANERLKVQCCLDDFRLCDLPGTPERNFMVLRLKLRTVGHERMFMRWARVRLEFKKSRKSQESDPSPWVVHCEPAVVLGENQNRQVTTHFEAAPEVPLPIGNLAVGSAGRSTERTKTRTWRFQSSSLCSGPAGTHDQEVDMSLNIPDDDCYQSFSNRSINTAALIEETGEAVLIRTAVVEGKAKHYISLSRCCRKFLPAQVRWEETTLSLSELRAMAQPTERFDSLETLRRHMADCSKRDNGSHAPIGTHISRYH
jgi:hypothetical protein